MDMIKAIDIAIELIRDEEEAFSCCALAHGIGVQSGGGYQGIDQPLVRQYVRYIESKLEGYDDCIHTISIYFCDMTREEIKKLRIELLEGFKDEFR